MAREPRIAEAAAMAAQHFNGKDGFANAQRRNVYVCIGSPSLPRAGCGHSIVTIDREPGVTPFMTRCERCSGAIQSRMYRVDQSLEPSHEWYRPDSLVGLDAGASEHVLRGGLLLREIVRKAAH